jgi:hypothetical protein
MPYANAYRTPQFLAGWYHKSGKVVSIFDADRSDPWLD